MRGQAAAPRNHRAILGRVQDLRGVGLCVACLGSKPGVVLGHCRRLGHTLHVGVEQGGDLLHQIGGYMVQTAGVEAPHIHKHFQVGYGEAVVGKIFTTMGHQLVL